MQKFRSFGPTVLICIRNIHKHIEFYIHRFIFGLLFGLSGWPFRPLEFYIRMPFPYTILELCEKKLRWIFKKIAIKRI